MNKYQDTVVVNTGKGPADRGNEATTSVEILKMHFE